MHEDLIKKIVNESIEAKKGIPIDLVSKASEIIISSIRNGGKLLICGNGGSAADAQHMAGEFVNRFKFERDPMACIALTTDTSVITAIGNDYSFDEIFSKQIEAYGKKEDVLLGISTSGKSKNVIRAMHAAKAKGIATIGFLGKDGGLLKNLCDIPIIIPSEDTARIQEGHELVMHIICEIVEKEIFKSN